MPNKKEIDINIIDNYVERFNKGEIIKEQIAKKLKISPRTWTEKVAESGWKYDKSKFKYYKDGQQEDIPGQMAMPNVSATENKDNKPVVKEMPINVDATDQPEKETSPNKNSNTLDSDTAEKNKSKAGRPQIQRDEPLIKRTFLITGCIDKAIKLKAINEGKGVNELVREIFLNSVEPKYFKGL